jgi:hypothetical protein
MHVRARLGFAAVGFTTVLHCGCGGGPAPVAPQAPAARGTPGKVYDSKGHEADCAPPAEHCAAAKPDRDFLDKCKLAGYRQVRCGCEDYCMGNAGAPKAHYDAKGQPKVCEPVKPDCPAADTSAAFQDACTDGGHKLVQCGCEWLCSGKLDKTP